MVFNIYQVTLRATFAGQNILVTPHFRKEPEDDVAGTADFQSVADAVKNKLRLDQTDELVYQDWTATQVAGAGVTWGPTDCLQHGGTVETGLFTGTLTGAVLAAEALPGNNAVCYSLKTGVRGRSHRGRLYQCAIPVTYQGDGTLTPSALALLNANLPSLIPIYGFGGSSPDWRWVIFSRVIASGCEADPNLRHHPLVHVRDAHPELADTVVTSMSVNTVVRSMRSRTVGRGS